MERIYSEVHPEAESSKPSVDFNKMAHELDVRLQRRAHTEPPSVDDEVTGGFDT